MNDEIRRKSSLYIWSSHISKYKEIIGVLLIKHTLLIFFWKHSRGEVLCLFNGIQKVTLDTNQAQNMAALSTILRWTEQKDFTDTGVIAISGYYIVRTYIVQYIFKK